MGLSVEQIEKTLSLTKYDPVKLKIHLGVWFNRERSRDLLDCVNSSVYTEEALAPP